MKIEIHRVSLGLLALMTLGGCASFNDCYYEKSQKVRAFKEYIHCGQPECSEYPRDYRKGWLDGFYEVATGGSDCPPSVAPARYYEPKAILKYCDKKRHEYYSGWQDGAARASQFPDTHYLRIYETPECPFPRCEKPCTHGQCGPGGTAFVGMSATKEMIEIDPSLTAPAPSNDVDAASSQLSATQTGESTSESMVSLTTPEGEAVDRSSDELASQAALPTLAGPAPTGPDQAAAAATEPTRETITLAAPTFDSPTLDSPTLAAPTTSMLTDIPTLPMIPPPPASESAEFSAEPTAAEKSAATQPKAEDTPLISIPGYRATTEWSRPAARPVKAQAAGFIRMVEPIDDAPKTRTTAEGAEPIVIVEAPYQQFQLSDRESETKPVIQLVE